MQAVKKTATIHQLRQDRKSHALAIVSGRVIKTTYYQYADKRHSVLNVRSMYMQTAAINVIKNMKNNRQNSMWAEVWNDALGLIIATVGRDVNGKIDVTEYFDTVTGKKLREQPWKLKERKTTLDKEKVDTLKSVLQLLHIFENHSASPVFFNNGVAVLDEFRTGNLSEQYGGIILAIRRDLDDLLVMPGGGIDKDVVSYIHATTPYKVVQDSFEKTTDGYRVVLNPTMTLMRSR